MDTHALQARLRRRPPPYGLELIVPSSYALIEHVIHELSHWVVLYGKKPPQDVSKTVSKEIGSLSERQQSITEALALACEFAAVALLALESEIALDGIARNAYSSAVYKRSAFDSFIARSERTKITAVRAQIVARHVTAILE